MEKQQLILLVEDDADYRVACSALLARYSYAVLEAVNGEDGVRQATRHRPDLVLMDLQMPVMDGWEAVGRIRETAAIADTPVVAVTGHDLKGESWREAGFSAYLAKPYRPRHLLETIQDFLPPRPEDP